MTDAETMVAIKDFFNSLGSEELYYHVDSSIDPSIMPDNLDFRSNYLFNTSIAGLEDDVDFVLLIGTNPRFEGIYSILFRRHFIILILIFIHLQMKPQC